MNLLIFSDIHGDIAALKRLLDTDADYYFAAGDLVSWGAGLGRIGPLFAARAERSYIIPGNHESAGQIAQFCEQFKLHDFHCRTIEIAGCHVAGLGYSNGTPFDTPGEYTEAEIAERLSHFAGLRPLILICHCPPKDTPLDQAGEGMHFGSEAVRAFIEKEEPEYFFCGHIHEAAGVETTLGKTRCWNVGKKGHLLSI
jgi:Icc-related predicted phosphoesterase